MNCSAVSSMGSTRGGGRSGLVSVATTEPTATHTACRGKRGRLRGLLGAIGAEDVSGEEEDGGY